MKRKIYIAIISAFLVTSVVLGLLWLTGCFIVVLAGYCMFSSDLKVVHRLRKQRFITVSGLCMGLFVLTIAIRLLFFEVFAIPSSSMEDTLFPGDKVLISKLNYGPRLPNSPFQIPWINLLYYYNTKNKSKTDSVWWNYKRLKGYTNVKRHDVFVFNHPYSKKMFFIKRCVGLPGDSIKIINGTVFINGERECTVPTSKINYRVWHNDSVPFCQIVDGIDIFSYSHRNANYIDCLLTKRKCEMLRKLSCIDSIKVKTSAKACCLFSFPWGNNFSWTIDNYGTMVIPKKGMTIQLNTSEYYYYRSVLWKFEKFKPSLKDGAFYVDGHEIKEYTIKKNYYFMMGDNRHHSHDSRMWGFVPEDNIVGKAVCVLFSNSENGLSWSRTLKMIN